jgi:flavorubredoxin
VILLKLKLRVDKQEVHEMNIDEIAPDVYRMSIYIPEADLQFNQFLVVDDEPLLFHTGMKALFPLVHETVSRIINPAKLRWVGFSHFEADECGSLNEWLDVAPKAEAICSIVGALVSINDFASRPSKGLADGEGFCTGKYNFRFLQTPHVPHCWEAGLLFEENNRTLFSSDLFHQNGNVEASTESDVVDRSRQALLSYQQGPLANYLPYTPKTDGILKGLADLAPKTIAAMHGSTFIGDGRLAIDDLAIMFRENLSV